MNKILVRVVGFVWLCTLLVQDGVGAASEVEKTAKYDHLAEATRAIVEEISAVEKKVGLYSKLMDEERKKIAVLKKLREELLKGSTVFGSDGSSSWTIEEIADYALSHALNGYRRQFSRSDQGKSQSAVARDPAEAYYNLFVKRSEIPFYTDTNGNSVADVDVLAIPLTAVGGGAGRKMAVGAARKKHGQTTDLLNLLVVTMTDGSIQIYNTESSELVSSMSSEGTISEANALKSDCDYFQFDAFCLTTNEDGSVVVNTLTIYNGGKYVSGHRLRLEPMDDKETNEFVGRTVQKTEAEAKYGKVPRTGVWVRIESKPFKSALPEAEEATTAGSSGKPGERVFPYVFGVGRMKLVLIGDSKGALEVYHRNGTLGYVFPVTAEKPILAMSHSFVNVAVSHGKGIHFYNPSRHQKLQHICHGGMGNMVFLAYDKLLSQVLYASSDDGIIYVFNTRTRSKRGVGCSLLHQLRVNATEKLFTAKGYLVSVGKNELNVFNTSTVLAMDPPALVARHTFKGGDAVGSSIVSMTDLGDAKTPIDSMFAILLPPTPGDKCEKEACPTLKVDLFSTLLKYKRPVSGGDDLSWFRAPLMVMAVIGVFVYQLQGKKGGRGASFPGMPGIGGSLTANEKDELKNVLERYGGANAFANRRSTGSRGTKASGRRGFPPM